MTAVSTWTFFLGGNVLILRVAVNSQEVVLEGLHHEALEDNCLRMNVSATVYKIVKIYITRWS